MGAVAGVAAAGVSDVFGYAINPEGKKVETYFHPVTQELVASEED